MLRNILKKWKIEELVTYLPLDSLFPWPHLVLVYQMLIDTFLAACTFDGVTL
jgi:hypothetical protein